MKLQPRIVASLGKNALMDAKAAKEADMLEVRLDLIEGDPLEAIRSIRESTSLPLIATNRWRSEGGQFKGSEEDRIELLCQASAYADMVDIELRAPMQDALMKRAGRPAIVSFHDFAGTPSPEDLKSLLKEISKTRASIAKIAVTPKRPRDNLCVLELLLEADMPLCVIAMGELGRHLRAVAPLYGSALTYGYISQPTASGQMSVADLRWALKIFGAGIA